MHRVPTARPTRRRKGAVALLTAAVIAVGVPFAGAASARADTRTPQEIAHQRIPDAAQYKAFSEVISHESGWNPTARNPSGAYGLGQALPAEKMAAFGADWRTNPATQIAWALHYMNTRYGSPQGAWDFWQRNHWY
ncbi:lytic transglycosylase domain-containing protein [Streptomyces sp. NPDC001594]|uniref:lytic transglycosylase domain-containing protein n=1 Tax=Streptomyces sp. NPDC001594 TaxID=3364590 RepID=UPI00369A3691